MSEEDGQKREDGEEQKQEDLEEKLVEELMEVQNPPQDLDNIEGEFNPYYYFNRINR